MENKTETNSEVIINILTAVCVTLLLIIILMIIWGNRKRILGHLSNWRYRCSSCVGDDWGSTSTAFLRRHRNSCSAWWNQSTSRCSAWWNQSTNRCSAWWNQSRNRCSAWWDQSRNRCSAWQDQSKNSCSAWWKQSRSSFESWCSRLACMKTSPARLAIKLSVSSLDGASDNTEKFEGKETSTRTASLMFPPNWNRIKREELEEYLTSVVYSTVDFETEFQAIPSVFNKSIVIATMPSNIKKNRYKNILPYDDTRVVLRRPPGATGTDYINANYIRSHKQPKAYIATQGPKDTDESTLGDFWSMVWENSTNIIIMIAKLVEGNVVKVSQYWPNALGECLQYGEVWVQLKTQKRQTEYVERCFLLTCKGESREVMHYQYTNWPDHSAPKEATGFTYMVRDFYQMKRTGPLVVHCSAGMGRTGTLLLILELLVQLEDFDLIDPLKTVVALRLGRARLVENKMQYQFAHQVLLELLYGEITSYPVDGFPKQLDNIRDRLEGQYQKLKNLPQKLTVKWGSHPGHAHMNRHQSVLPVDGRQVFLYMINGQRESQYINAVRVDGVDCPDANIVTEHPLPFTLQRVWRMMYEKRVSTWVLLHAQRHDDQEYPPVLPAAGQCQTDELFIKVDHVNIHHFFTETFVSLNTKTEPSLPLKLRVLQLLTWNSEELPGNVNSLLYLLQYHLQLRQNNPASPTVFTCRDGYTACGMAVALDLVLSRIWLGGEVDVYRAVRTILLSRPQFITSLRQYVFLHDATVTFLKLTNGTTDLNDEVMADENHSVDL